MNLREINRKLRGGAEHERMLRRYHQECGPVTSYRVPPEALQSYYPGMPLQPCSEEESPQNNNSEATT